MKKPDFFVIGVPKSGTSAMHHYLMVHPQIFMSGHKESLFFAKDLDSGGPQDTPYFIRDPREYEALFNSVTDEKRVGETSIFYMHSQDAARNIKEYYPNADLIAMLRNPVDMMYALHAQHIVSATEDITDFKEALDAEEERKRGGRPTQFNITFKCLFYRQIADYVTQIERYQRHFGREKMHFIIYDDFKKDAAATYKSTLQFLGVSDEFTPEFQILNPSKRIRNMALRNMLQRPPGTVRAVAKALLPSYEMRQRLLKKIWMFNMPETRRPPMDDELRLALQQEFSPQVERLSEMLDRDLVDLWFGKDI